MIAIIGEVARRAERWGERIILPIRCDAFILRERVRGSRCARVHAYVILHRTLGEQ